MMSYPVITGNAGIDTWLVTLLRQGARAQNLSEVETQQCIVTFSRRMLHTIGRRRCSGEPMTGAQFVDWLTISAKYHQAHFLNDYRAVAPYAGRGSGSKALEISRGISSKQNEIGVDAAEAVMLSNYDCVLASAVCQLIESSRVIILWHYFSGISVREIAEKIGLSEIEVRSRITRAGREMQMVLARRSYATQTPDNYTFNAYE